LAAAALVAVALVYLGLAPDVRAHANLVRAEPAPNAVLDSAPSQVTIWFTEPLEPQFGQIQVLDSAGRRVDNDDSTVGQQDPTMVSVTLQPLADGAYTVAWSNVSTVDAHKVRGAYVFSVGEPIGNAVALEPPQQPLLQSPLEPVLRWLTLLSIMTIVGGLIFQLLIMRPALHDAGPARVFRKVAQALGQRSVKLNWIAWGLLLVASAGHLLLQTTISYELPLFQAIGRPLGTLLFDTTWGRLWLWRLALLLVLASFLWLAGRHHGTESAGGWAQPYELLALAAGLGVLLTLSLSSHAAATGQIQAGALFNDYLHLLAATVWVGGLFHFVLAVPLIRERLNAKQQRALLAAAVPRFSRLAILSVAVLAVTGLYGAWAQVTVPAALATPYGRTLLAKVGLVALILILAGANLLWVRPRLAQEEPAGRRLQQLLAGEATLALLVLLLVGLLTALEPARQVASREGAGRGKALAFEDSDEGATINLEISPGLAGPNQMLVELADGRGRPIDNASDVSLRLTYLDTDLGASTVPATNLGDGKYQADGAILSLAGAWQVEVVVRRPDAFDARAAFRMQAPPAAAGSSATIAPAPDTGRLLWALELAVLGLALSGVGLAAALRRRQREAVAISQLIAIVSGIAVLAAAETEEPPGTVALATGGNPFLPDSASLAAGQQVYEEHCMVCHGLPGHGDGPRSAGIDAVDIIEHVPLHADSEYFDIVPAHGARGDLVYSTSEISEDDIWHLVNYLHAFEPDQLLAEEYFGQARDLAEQGDLEGALALLDQVIELSPRFVQALQGRGIISMDQGNIEQAIADQSQIIALDPTYADGFYYRAEAYRLSGQLQEAAADYSEREKAIEDLQRFLQLEPQSGDRAAVEELIAQLGGPAVVPAGHPAGAVVLGLVDLPAGFEALPPANLGLVEGAPIEIGTTIARSFAFGHSERFELVWGYTTPLPGEAEQSAFDSRLNVNDLVAFLRGGLRADEVSESAALPDPAGLGDASQGVTAVFTSEGLQARLDGLAFRRGDVGVLLFVAYTDGARPAASVTDLARTLVDRIDS
jgi:copper transport protein